jgi:mRNA-degrading endonuclease RelE of RelBE toxin-antitoxin system
MAHMARKKVYGISYDQATGRQLRAIDVKYHSLIRVEIEEQLQFQPGTETRNRKPLRQPAPFEATWELRFGPGNCFRVLYGIDDEHREVQIQAIGVKEGNRLLVGGKKVDL